MQPGNIQNDVLNKLILSKINIKRDDVLLRPNIGEDCTAIEFGDLACVLSTDPITGAAKDVGRLAVHISCNDIASSGVQPIGILVTLLCPVDTTEKDVEQIMEQICSTASDLNVEIIGGHTEITRAVNKIVVSTTVVGKAPKESIITSGGAKPGDSVIMTKTAGLEGTAIIANDFEERLIEFFDESFINEAKNFINNISVVKEGLLAGSFGVSSMHDITEGGVLGAAWEISEASGVGISINKADIPIDPITIDICRVLEIDPLKLISSGCMIITCSEGARLVRLLEENGIRATIIGTITADKTCKKLISQKEGLTIEIVQPEADELFKIV